MVARLGVKLPTCRIFALMSMVVSLHVSARQLFTMQDKEIRAAKLKDEAAKKAEQARADEERRKQRDEEYLRKKAEEAAASKGQSTAVSSSAPSASSSTSAGGAPEGANTNHHTAGAYSCVHYRF